MFITPRQKSLPFSHASKYESGNQLHQHCPIHTTVSPPPPDLLSLSLTQSPSSFLALDWEFWIVNLLSPLSLFDPCLNLWQCVESLYGFAVFSCDLGFESFELSPFYILMSLLCCHGFFFLYFGKLLRIQTFITSYNSVLLINLAIALFARGVLAYSLQPRNLVHPANCLRYVCLCTICTIHLTIVIKF